MRNLAQINERLVLGSGEDGVNDRMWVFPAAKLPVA
jgi:hypothetical protein